MTAPGNNVLQILLALAFVIASGYAAGRIHQWYKHGLERDHAYREGYDQASRQMFDMAIRSRSGRAPAAEAPQQRTTGTTLAFPEPVGHGRAVGSRRRILTPEVGRRRGRPAA
jgi:hypothetical protein